MAFPFGKPEDIARAMKRLGITLEEERASRIVIELEDGHKLLVEDPKGCVIMKSKDQPPVIMIVGEYKKIKEEVPAKKFSEEDVQFVAEQAGVSYDEARRALEEVGGDVAAAILKLTGGK
ncbi:MAG: nascent polypeptide-associated complex protein [Acidilobaceae archaeon]|nr:nascent polypeptide-associated complex protein [Acidilobaceae archaeon]MCX8165895.1 nascent polypeptide-associated complex protein [Acidilobaceae archaeon]MDW7974537.1 nascent polypeptide-associated complex protein [Sulfolobales archaeon]